MKPYTDEQLAQVKKIIQNAERYAYKMTKDNPSSDTWNKYFHDYLDTHTDFLNRVKINAEPVKNYA